MPINDNMLPEDYLETRIARRTNAICLTLFVLVICGVVAAYFITDRQRREVQTLQLEVNRQFEEAARQIEQIEHLQKQKQQMLHKAQVTGILVERVPRTIILSELINHMPVTLSLLEVDMSTQVLRTAPRPLTAIERDQQRRQRLSREQSEEQEQVIEVPKTELSLNLIGVAPTDVEVSQFIAALNRHKLFKDVNLQYSEQAMIDSQRLRKFRIQLNVNQDVNVQEFEPTRVARDLKQNPLGQTLHIDSDGQFISPGTSDATDESTVPGVVGVNPNYEE